MLQQVAPGIGVWFGSGHHGDANATVVIDDDGLTVIDALVSPQAAAPLADACDLLGSPIRRLVLTSSHIEYVGGSSVFGLAAVYGTPQISAHLDQPPNIEGCRRLFPDHAAEFVDLTTRPVSHMVAEAAWITATAVAVPLGGELAENLAVQIPEQGVVVCGALASFGTTPLLFDGDPAQLVGSLDVIAGYGSVFVPGHGPVGSHDDLADLRAYLEACIAAAGEPSRLGSGPWDGWSDRHFDAVNVERAAMLAAGDPSPPPSMLRLLGMS
jgi:glyoxylase-like metal-dependent hydrolase (beta-lactamase superfamily II)